MASKFINKKNISVILIAIVIIGLITVVGFICKPKSDDATLKQALAMIDEYYKYYNNEDYDKIKPMLLESKKGKGFIKYHLTHIKQFRKTSGKYLGYKYPNEPIKNIVIPDTTDKTELTLHLALAQKKYGKNIFEDATCLKNRYSYIQPKNPDNPLEICITRKFEKVENNHTFLFVQTPNGLKIFLTPEFFNAKN